MADISAVKLVSEAVEATPPYVAESDRADLGQYCSLKEQKYVCVCKKTRFIISVRGRVDPKLDTQSFHDKLKRISLGGDRRRSAPAVFGK